MKRTAGSFLCAWVCYLACMDVGAQTCSAPGSWHPDPTGAPSISADTCALPDSVALYCDFLDSSNKGDAIWQVTYAAGYTATTISVAGGTASFNPVIYLYSSACTLGNQCVASGDAGTPMPITTVPPGTYFLASSAAPADGAGSCGTVTLSTNGYLPVELQTFDVE